MAKLFSRITAAAAALCAALFGGACTDNVGRNPGPEEVYGPPEPDIYESVYGPPEDPDYWGIAQPDNLDEIEDVYGPPSYFGMEDDEPDDDDAANIPAPVYGPPNAM